SKHFEADRRVAFGYEIGVEKILVTEFVPGVLVHISRHVFVEDFQRRLKGLITQGQFIVLLPQISLENLGRRQEPQQSRVAAWQPTAESIRAHNGPARQQTACRYQRGPTPTDAFKK